MTNKVQELQRTSGPEHVQRVDGRERPALVFTPAANIIETADNFMLDIDMPGVSDKGIDLTLENDVLSIRGQIELENYPTFRPSYHEYEIGDYRRVFTLTHEVDRDRIQATIKDGVLHLVLPKADRVKPRKIHVHAT